MLKSNVGSTDRIIRVLTGIALLLGFFVAPQNGWQWLYLIGAVPLLTGLLGTCPIYTVLGISTCRIR